MRRTVLLAVVLLVSACGSTPEAEKPTPGSPAAAPETSATIDHLLVGPPPRIGYILDHRFVAPDGQRLKLPTGWGFFAAARLGDGVLAQDDRNLEGYTGIELVRNGRVVEEWGTRGNPVVGRDGAVAWGEATYSDVLDPPPPAIRLQREDVRLTQVVHPPPTNVAGILGDEVLYTAWPVDHPNHAARITNLRSPPRALPLRSVIDVDEEHRRLLAQIGDGRPAVMTLTELTPLWSQKDRDFRLTRFSPSGRLVLGETYGPDHPRSATGQGLVVVESRTGEERRRIALPMDTTRVVQTMWETERSILVVVEAGPRAAVLRVVGSGRIEVAVPPIRKPRDFGYPIVLAEQS